MVKMSINKKINTLLGRYKDYFYAKFGATGG